MNPSVAAFVGRRRRKAAQLITRDCIGTAGGAAPGPDGGDEPRPDDEAGSRTMDGGDGTYRADGADPLVPVATEGVWLLSGDDITGIDEGDGARSDSVGGPLFWPGQ